jgi:hypothetical protein
MRFIVWNTHVLPESVGEVRRFRVQDASPPREGTRPTNWLWDLATGNSPPALPPT